MALGIVVGRSSGSLQAKTCIGESGTKVNFKGKKGDTMHHSCACSRYAYSKSSQHSVTFIADTAGVVDVLINKHFELPT